MLVQTKVTEKDTVSISPVDMTDHLLQWNKEYAYHFHNVLVQVTILSPPQNNHDCLSSKKFHSSGFHIKIFFLHVTVV